MLLSSSLRRTLVRSVLYSAILAVFLSACKNPKDDKDKILEEFEKVNNELKKIDSSIYSVQGYVSLMERAANDSATLDLHDELLGFHFYLGDIRKRFCKAAGDSAGVTIPEDKQHDIELTNRFFRSDTVLYLFPTLSRLREYTHDTTLIRKIDQLEVDNDNDLIKKYFLNTPPLAVLTMLNYFDQKIMEITFEVLRRYFKSR